MGPKSVQPRMYANPTSKVVYSIRCFASAKTEPLRSSRLAHKVLVVEDGRKPLNVRSRDDANQRRVSISSLSVETPTSVLTLTGIDTQSVQPFADRQHLVLVVRNHRRDCRSGHATTMMRTHSTLGAIPEPEPNEDAIDAILQDTFPASDSPSWTLGVHPGEAPMRKRNGNHNELKEN